MIHAAEIATVMQVTIYCEPPIREHKEHYVSVVSAARLVVLG